MSKQYKGIDVSFYQGNVNWTAVKNSGIDFVIIRAGYGRFISQKDPKFEEYYAGAKAAGLKVGTYWYSYARSAAEALIEADVFLKCIQGKEFDYPAFYDVEEAYQRGSIANAIIPAFLEKVKSAGYYVGLYTFYDFSMSIDASIKNKYDMWIAHVGVNSTPYKGHTIWQYSWTAQVPGINCPKGVDADYCYVDYPSIIKGTNSNPVTEKPQEVAKPVEQPTTTDSNVLQLNNTPLYSSSTAKTASGTKTGTFYRYDNAVLNGRIRITNSAANVGKTPMGNYVTGWIDNPAGSTVAATPKTEAAPVAAAPAPITAGQKVVLNNVDLYSSSTAKKVVTKKSGTFYLYDTKVLNGRIRITNSAANVGKTPIGNYVTGWIDKSSI